MTHISIQEVTRENWRMSLALAVHPDQQRFVAASTPIAAIALAKAYIRPNNLVWKPYAFYTDTTMIGFIEFAYLPNSHDHYWIYHFFIDYGFQGKGYGKLAIQTFVTFVTQQYPLCETIQLTVHPENVTAQRLYMGVGFEPTGQEIDNEPVYRLAISKQA